MKAYLTLCFLCCWLLSCAQKPAYNIDAEELNPTTKMPKDWGGSLSSKEYHVQLDNLIKHTGKHSISIEKIGRKEQFGTITYAISKAFEGKTIQLKGYIKTEQVDSGFAGLWMRIDGREGSIAFDNMAKKNIMGTHDWTPYSIDLPYDSEAAREIYIGGLLVGKGKVWFDNFQLFIDGKPIDEVLTKEISISKAEKDTAFSTSSRIQPFKTNPQIINNLTVAGQFWAFLKYYHPAIAKGDYNWDAELFRFLPQVIKATNNSELSNILETQLDKLQPPSPADNSGTNASKVIALKPDYGQLFSGAVFSKSLTNKLTAVKKSPRGISHYYVSFMGAKNPKFENEESYAEMAYPDAGYRLLSLFRYWAMINYFFPYKDVIGTDWNKALSSRIPEFVEAKDEQEYVLATLKMIASIHDTHANIWSSSEVLNQFRGKYKLPFKAEFIENKLVVTGYYADTLNVKQKFLIGDVVSSINGKAVETLVKQYLPYTAASNYDTQLRDLPGSFLLRGNAEVFTLGINRGGKAIKETTAGLDAFYYPKSNPETEKKAFKLLDQNTGYVYPGKYKNTDLPAIQELFRNTKGIIIDMRCYPSDFMPFTFGEYIKPLKTPFVKFTVGEFSQPGRFTYSEPVSNGAVKSTNYRGKVIVIVNSTSQSQAEYTTMAFQSSPNVTVIGSTTAGADGNVSQILLPGGISTMISGIGVFYPDGTSTQRVGIKIDHFLKPTIKGTIEGRDELLEKAKEILKNSPK